MCIENTFVDSFRKNIYKHIIRTILDWLCKSHPVSKFIKFIKISEI